MNINILGLHLSASEFLALIQTLLLLATFVVSIIESRQNLKKADAAESRSAKNVNIIASSLENIALKLESQKQNSVGVRWVLSWQGKDSYLLENVGDEIAKEVVIHTDSTMPLFQLPSLPIKELAPRESVQFMAIRTFGTIDATVRVTWEKDDGESATWARALPMKNQ